MGQENAIRKIELHRTAVTLDSTLWLATQSSTARGYNLESRHRGRRQKPPPATSGTERGNVLRFRTGPTRFAAIRGDSGEVLPHLLALHYFAIQGLSFLLQNCYTVQSIIFTN